MFKKVKNLKRKKGRATMSAVSLGIILVFWLFFTAVGQTAAGQQEPGQQDLTYEVSVRAQVVPVFAVDAEGNPVYDLQEDEIEFSVNGKPAKIETFRSYTFDEDQGKGAAVDKEKPSPDRINFIILDWVMIDGYGMRRCLEIATKIVEGSGPNDAFIALVGARHTGLTYVFGPEKDKEKITAALADAFTRRVEYTSKFNINMRPGHKKRRRHTYRSLTTISGSNEADLRERKIELANIENEVGLKEYESVVAVFTDALAQLKYALKTITLPKNVYLFTGGLHKNADTGMLTIRYYDFLKKAAVAVNYGGSMLYLVNPNRMEDIQMNDALKFMAEVSGGKSFYGSNVENIVTQVRNTTSAYYELGFFPDQHTKDDKLKISLKCKRKGIKLHTINFSERPRPYKDMPVIQKKMFALNVITGGSWSRMVGKVEQTSYKKLDSTNENTKNIEVKTPPELKNRESDIYILNLDPKTFKATIAVQTKVLDEKETISVPVEEGKEQYVVLVEPMQTQCVFTGIN